jgi:uroporphyrinogen decarboxylase
VSSENVKCKTMKKSASTLELSEYSIVTKEDWEENKPRFVFNESRINITEAKTNQENTKNSVVQVYMEPCLGFEKFKYCMGTEMLLVAIAEDPEWVKDMVEMTERLAFDGLDYCLSAGLEFDIGYITEDMGFSNGPFFSPAFYREIIYNV